MDPFTAMLLSAGIQGGIGLLNKPNGTGGGSGYDVVNFNDPNDIAQRQASGGYLMDQLSALRAGQVPDWLKKFTDEQQAFLLKQNRNQMFGREGSPGGSIADAAMSAGAAQGVGGKAAMAPVNKALADYADRMSGINQYITGIKSGYMTNAATTIPTNLATMSAQKNSIMPINTPATASTNPFGNINLSGIDWTKFISPNPVSTPAMPAASQYGSVTPQNSFALNTSSMYPGNR